MPASNSLRREPEIACSEPLLTTGNVMSRSAELFGDATSVSVLDVFRLGCLIHHVIFKRDAFRIVLRKPCIGGVVGPRQANYYSMFAK